MNQRTLAAHVGINFTYLSKIETGTMLPPSADTIVKLAKVLETDADELLQLANKVPEDLKPLITKSPGLPAFLRSIRDLSKDELADLSSYAAQVRKRRRGEERNPESSRRRGGDS